jgi:spore maturation protein CgeB
VLETLEQVYGAARARPLYCAVDPTLYYPEAVGLCWDLGYMGTYSPDRQPGLETLLLTPAACRPSSRFVVVGPNYPASILWSANVERIEHLPPDRHRAFYNGQRFTLNLTRASMVRWGYSPSVRLFEAAACGVPIISDSWPGLDSYFAPSSEILLAHRAAEVLHYLNDLSELERQAIGEGARAVVLAQHTADRRAQQLEQYVQECH